MEKGKVKFYIGDIMRKTKRIDKIVNDLGYGSRTKIREMIKNGQVVVDKEIIFDPKKHVDPFNTKIYINGIEHEYKEYCYYMMNKPNGYISATFDDKQRTIMDLLPQNLKNLNLFPVGRLDIDTEGLLILTNNGQLAHRILSPKSHVPKKYYAKIEGCVDDRHVNIFRDGVVLEDGYKTMSSELNVLENSNISQVEITIYEGKFHQIKRMFLSVEKKVIFLKRLKMGGLSLDENLAPGDYKEIFENDIELIM
jgi:16S rRNA pseudouridine516 synthase